MAGRGAGGFCERRGNVCLPGNRHSPESAVDTPGGLVLDSWVRARGTGVQRVCDCVFPTLNILLFRFWIRSSMCGSVEQSPKAPSSNVQEVTTDID